MYDCFELSFTNCSTISAKLPWAIWQILQQFLLKTAQKTKKRRALIFKALPLLYRLVSFFSGALLPGRGLPGQA